MKEAMSVELPPETTQTPPLRSRGGRAQRRKRGYFFRDILVIFVVALLASTLIKTFLVQSFYIPSGSMQNTLQIQDRVLVNKLVPGVIGLEHGDVVVFKDPGGWLDNQPQQSSPGNPVSEAIGWVLAEVGLGAQDSNDHLIKRVIGLPGGNVKLSQDHLGNLSQTHVDGARVGGPSALMAFCGR